MKSGFVLRGDVVIERRRKDGSVIDHEELKNLVVNSGLERIAKLLSGVSSADFGYLAIGIGTNVAANGDTALQTEVKRELSTSGGTYEADYKAVFEKTFAFSSGDSYAITEAGLMDGAVASGSTMFDRFVFTAKNVDADTELLVRVTITASRV